MNIYFTTVREMVYNTPMFINWGGILIVEFMSVIEAAIKWKITRRRIQVLCNQGRIHGAQKVGTVWIIPSDTEKPKDARFKGESN